MMPLNPKKIQEPLLTWYEQFGRKTLPWKKEKNAYHIWVSEIMLQQTQVKTVIPYFERFIKHFPNIQILAQESLDEVLKLWAGLGYYTRARNLHRCAEILIDQYQGQFPQQLEQLIQLPGIGQSTAGAILSFAFNLPETILDGNVQRVLIRYHAINDLPTKLSVKKDLWELAKQYTPHQKTADYNQAIMDIGALICIRQKPKCIKCPLQRNCRAYQENRTSELPQKRPKKILPKKSIYLLILLNQQHEILLEKRPTIGIWGGLWSFPELLSLEAIESNCKNKYGLEIESTIFLSPIQHTFSHFRCTMTPIMIKTKRNFSQMMEPIPLIWYNNKNILPVGVPQPIKKLIATIHTLQAE